MIRVTVPGRPVPKGRPRLGVRGRKAFIYTPAETKAYEQAVGLCANLATAEPLEGPVTLSATLYIRRGRRGDLDNYLKSICDGLNEVAWKDDRQVVRIEAEIKRCSRGDERVEIEIREVGESAETA